MVDQAAVAMPLGLEWPSSLLSLISFFEMLPVQDQLKYHNLPKSHSPNLSLYPVSFLPLRMAWSSFFNSQRPCPSLSLFLYLSFPLYCKLNTLWARIVLSLYALQCGPYCLDYSRR